MRPHPLSPEPGARRAARVRRRRITVVVAVAVAAGVALAILGAAPAARSSHPRSPGGVAVPATVRVPPTTPPPATAVGQTALTVADGTRRFTTTVMYPAYTPGAGAAPAGAGRPWPLIVFSPGFDIAPGAYQALLDRWVAAGFVVAEAEYPRTAPDAPGGVDEDDIVAHPADLRAALDAVVAQSATAGTLLAGTVDASRIGAAGHSDGGDVTDAVVADSCCRDSRIRAAAVLSGAELSSFGGQYGPPGIPLLVVQGDADQVNAPACSQQIYAGAGPPRFYLDLRGAGHRAPYLASGPYRETAAQAAVYEQAVDRATVLFWQGYLKGDRAALAELGSGAGLPAAAAMDTGAVPAPPGGCPGAPP